MYSPAVISKPNMSGRKDPQFGFVMSYTRRRTVHIPSTTATGSSQRSTACELGLIGPIKKARTTRNCIDLDTLSDILLGIAG